MTWITIESDLDWGGGISIEDLRLELDRLEHLGADTIEIEAYSNYGYPGVDIEATKTRSDEEIN